MTTLRCLVDWRRSVTPMTVTDCHVTGFSIVTASRHITISVIDKHRRTHHFTVDTIYRTVVACR